MGIDNDKSTARIPYGSVAVDLLISLMGILMF